MKSMEEVKRLRKMSYGEMANLFREKERSGQSITGYITFTEDSFDMQYREEARTYVVGSNNKAFQPNMLGYSIYGSAIDDSDRMVRLEGYMRDEKGGEDGWQIEACYVDEPYKEAKE